MQNFAAMSVGLALMGVGLGVTGGLTPPTGYLSTLWLGGPEPTQVAAWWPIVAMGIANYGAGYTLWLFALEDGARRGEGHKLPPLTYLTLVFAVVVGWVVLREGFGAGFWQGTVLIAVGNAVTVWPGRRVAGGECKRAQAG